MSLALITLSPEGAQVMARLAAHWPQADRYIHACAAAAPEAAGATTFESVMALSTELFHPRRGLIYIAPCGVVVRAIAPHLKHKLSDPAVVVVDVRGRWAVSLLSGHEGGANDLALEAANALGAEPVITTTSEAQKRIIVGIGCRRGVGEDVIIEAIRGGLERAGLCVDDVRLLASADLKANEQGLIDAARTLGLPLRFIAGDEIRASSRDFTHYDFVQEKVNLPAVAEPAALLAGRRTELLLRRTIINGVTVAVARENSL